MRRHYFIDSSDKFVETICQMARMVPPGRGRDGGQHGEGGQGQERFARYEIREEYGTGSVEVYQVMEHSTLVLFDVAFCDDVIFEYDMKSHYVGVTYCIDGEMERHEQGYEGFLFAQNHLFVSKSAEMKGRTCQHGGQRYQCVSLNMNSEHMIHLLGKSGIELWDDTMGRLERLTRRQYVTGGQLGEVVTNIFRSIFYCELPEKSKILYYEGKVKELLSLLVSGKLPGLENDETAMLLDDYEIRQIRLGHERLMENRGHPPTLNQLSKELAISRNKLAKGYKLIYGKTIYDHYRTTCMQDAVVLLSDLNKSVQDIALDIGYSNASNFCNAFKREFGVTPLQYRKIRLKNASGQSGTRTT
ncbi:helix-turn-helix transcriptional regulator [Cohnella phaseoli]|uniref:AraC-like DNA-binding protein n=1 Tax=Cohnella phaseoli TaxID=456490 RepID=A0A3D9HQY6_9BACL|nr:AraC family transcriptional regulator [Cohnella phaseoli]RED51913.1 AraC-like DNA-binding protein [Cohnella phaseoli]